MKFRRFHGPSNENIQHVFRPYSRLVESVHDFVNASIGQKSIESRPGDIMPIICFGTMVETNTAVFQSDKRNNTVLLKKKKKQKNIFIYLIFFFCTIYEVVTSLIMAVARTLGERVRIASVRYENYCGTVVYSGYAVQKELRTQTV